MSDEIVIKEVEVNKLRLRPGDILVFTLPEGTHRNWVQKFAYHVGKVIPRSVTSLIVAGDIKVTVAAKVEEA